MHKINHSLWIKPILSVDNMGLLILYKMLITFLLIVDNVEKLFCCLFYKGGYVYKVVDKIGEV